MHFAAPYVERGLMQALNPAELKYDVGFHMVTRHRRHHDEILRALLEDIGVVPESRSGRGGWVIRWLVGEECYSGARQS